MNASIDVTELCAAAGLNGESYRTFDQPQPARANIPPASAVVEISNETLPRALPSAMPLALRKFRETETTAHTGVAFVPASGGSGVTTLVGAVAKLLSSRNEPVLVANGAALSMLPFHLGAPAFSQGVWSLLTGRDKGAIHIVSPGQKDAAQDDLAWLHQSMETFHQPWSRMLLDVGAAQLSALAPLCTGGITQILVAVPDFASRIRLPYIISAISTDKSPCFVLFNQFDNTKAGHIATYDELRRRFGPTILPFTIRSSELVGDALSLGQTVCEFAPDSVVAADIAQLTEYLDRLAGVRIGTKPA